MNSIVSGFLFWLILSKITTPDVIGISSSIISFVTIFSIVSLVGMPGGIQRYLVRSINERKIDNVRGNINSSLFILSLGITGSCVLIFFIKDWIFYSFSLDLGLSIILFLTMGFLSAASLLNAIMVTTMNTRIIATSSIIGTVIKLSITLILVLSGIEVYGILTGYLLAPLVSTVILAMTIKRKILKRVDDVAHADIKIERFKSLRDIFVSGTSFWIPGVCNIIGSQLGTVLVLLSVGATQAGIYFISYSIATAIILINSVLSTIAYPAVSSMDDGRKSAVWRFMKISMLLTLPLSISAIFYSGEILGLFNNIYSEGSSYLQILLLSILPTTIMSGTSVLTYAYGNNRQVLSIGLFTNIPRILLYFVFVPLLGGIGAAFIYLLGSVIGCVVSLVIGKKIGLKVFWKKTSLIILIPVILLILFKFSGVHYILSIMTTLVLTYILFIRLKIIDKEDIDDITKILPPKISNLISMTFMRISKQVRKR
ncbi:oligosaccharide flippase family protein [Candidatus Nitrosocosmicus franklandus]|uniref:Polysaccharide biosynthesis protein n=1 Tax=Candidatus Nitrosocosmicus franklandianus TaxID=1798806 RepID=A0A484I5X7_9ARCH|nr:oligosaccharide flippase family protein [Candidatus Nitrosocosmicus franklandus]VFJ12513.1 Polysaccharide biosynthesis protein [Candidatus Nitrosocosmicus franklandus]